MTKGFALKLWPGIKHFQPSEFDSPDLKGSGERMNLEFVGKLDQLRSVLSMPLAIASGYRTPEHNAKVGGVDSSAHETGNAADIVARASGTRFKLLQAALAMGFRRIGVGAGFIHLDDSLTHPQDVVWLYPSK